MLLLFQFPINKHKLSPHTYYIQNLILQLALPWHSVSYMYWSNIKWFVSKRLCHMHGRRDFTKWIFQFVRHSAISKSVFRTKLHLYQHLYLVYETCMIYASILKMFFRDCIWKYFHSVDWFFYCRRRSEKLQ